VRSATFLGPTVEYDIEVDGRVLAVVDHEWVEHEVHQPGERVAWSFRDEQAYALGPDSQATPESRTWPELTRGSA
jgi:hypothetical protein